MRWAMFILTVISCSLTIYYQHMCNIFKKGFIILAKVAYNPKTEQDVKHIMEKLAQHGFNEIKETDNE